MDQNLTKDSIYAGNEQKEANKLINTNANADESFIIEDNISIQENDDDEDFIIGDELSAKEKNAQMMAALKERAELFEAQKTAGSEQAVGRYKAVDKGKTGYKKRHVDEDRLKKQKRGKNYVDRINHRSYRVVEKWKGTYDTDIQRTIIDAMDLNSVVNSFIKRVPSIHMSEEKYLADHTDDVKAFFKESLYLEDALSDPENKAYFKKMNDNKRDLLMANITMAKDVRKACKLKLYTMGVRLVDERWDHITLTYITKDRDDAGENENAQKELKRLKEKAMINDMRENAENSVRMKILEAEQKGQPLTQGEKIRLRTEAAKKLLESVNTMMETEARKRGLLALDKPMRRARTIGSYMAIFGGMTISEAGELAGHLNENKTDRTDEEKDVFVSDMEKVMVSMDTLDLAPASAVGTNAQLKQNTKDHFTTYLLCNMLADMDAQMSDYDTYATERPEARKLPLTKVFNATANRNYYTSLALMRDQFEIITSNDAFMNSDYMKGKSLDDLAAISPDEADQLFTDYQTAKNKETDAYLKALPAYSGLTMFCRLRDDAHVTCGDTGASIRYEKQSLAQKPKFKNIRSEQQS